jgi:DNA phosphorothioation-associated DGQHR protein 1
MRQTIPAIKVSQPLGDFYIAKIKAGDLLRISASSVLRYEKDGSLKGHQRQLNPERLKAIANFVQSEEMCFPSSIIVAANVNERGLIEEENKRWIIHHDCDDLYNLEIPDGYSKSALIIDGQHRLNSFNLAPGEFLEIELVCSIFFDLPSPYQAYLFATINGNQKRVDKSLSLELFGFSIEGEPENTWSPEKLAVFLTRKFNFTKDSPLYQRIKLAPLYSQIEEKVDKEKWLLSTAAMVDGILKLISSNPQYDRDMLVMKRKESIFGYGTRKSLSKYKDKTVLRGLYLNNDDEKIYNIICSFFQSVKELLWEKAKPNSVIVKTIGISVLFDILKMILEKDLQHLLNLIDLEGAFEERIKAIKDIDYSNYYFQLSGVGKTRLKRIMKFQLGFIGKESLDENDFQFIYNDTNGIKYVSGNSNEFEDEFVKDLDFEEVK